MASLGIPYTGNCLTVSPVSNTSPSGFRGARRRELSSIRGPREWFGSEEQQGTPPGRRHKGLIILSESIDYSLKSLFSSQHTQPPKMKLMNLTAALLSRYTPSKYLLQLSKTAFKISNVVAALRW